MSPVVAQVAVLPVGVVSHPHRAYVVSSMRPPARTVGDRPLCHLYLGKTARCIAVTASSRSVPLVIAAAMTRTAIVIAEAAMVMAIPVGGVVTDEIAAIPAGKSLEGHPIRVPGRATRVLPSLICLESRTSSSPWTSYGCPHECCDGHEAPRL